MKRASGLFSRICAVGNLELALRRALAGKRSKGDACAFLAALPGSLDEVAQRLRSGAGPVGRFTEFTVHDPKERRISAPCFEDRVLHHAVLNVCEPELDRYQIHDSYACRLGKGQFVAVARAVGYARHHERFVKFDVRKYFESIPRERLWRRLTRRFKEEPLLELWWLILDSWQPGAERGLPIGALTSQHLANFYLAELDHQVKETWRASAYVRYMDDGVWWMQTRREAREAETLLADFAWEPMGLVLKPPFSNRVEHGMDFLGHRIFPWAAQLNARSRRRFARKSAELRSLWECQEIEDAEYGERMRALVAFTEHSGCTGFRQRVLSR